MVMNSRNDRESDSAVGCGRAAWLPVPARAHNGPPFPIIENQKVGPCMISLWTHPDVGTGTFFVSGRSAAGQQVPDDLKSQIGIQPESGRLARSCLRRNPRGQRRTGRIQSPGRVRSGRVLAGPPGVAQARKAAAKIFREWKPRLRASDDGTFCFICYRFLRSGSCGFAASHVREAAGRRLQVA